MEHQKLEVNQIWEGLKNFIKDQFKRIDSWVMISVCSYLGTFGLVILATFVISCAVILMLLGLLGFIGSHFLSLLPNSISSALTGNYMIAIVSLLVAILFLFLSYKLLKKAIGIGNLVMLNALAAVDNQDLPKFSKRDERLSFVGYFLLYFTLLALGMICFIIPGIIFLVRCSLGYTVMLDQHCSPLEALKRSWNITEGNFWPLFVFVFPMYCIGFISPINFIFWFIPVNIWIFAYMYHQLKEQKAA